jgi:UDP-glucuronate 4-epimerase
MAAFKFVDAILAGREINIYNNGDMLRDFTYIDDIVDGISTLLDKNPRFKDIYTEDSSKKDVPHQILNLGNSSPASLMDFLSIIEENLGIKAKILFKPIQPGDVVSTYADMNAFGKHTGMVMKTSLDRGIKSFVFWFKQYYWNKS